MISLHVSNNSRGAARLIPEPKQFFSVAQVKAPIQEKDDDDDDYLQNRPVPRLHRIRGWSCMIKEKNTNIQVV